MIATRPLTTVSREKTFAIILSIVYFFISLYLYPKYTNGDQVFYREFYENAENLGLADAYLYYQAILGTSEPGYFAFVMLIARFFEKDVIMSFLNGALIYSLITWSERKKVSWIAIALLSVNFYLLVLLFSAERLKLGILFLMLAVNSYGFKKPLYVALSFLSHTQTILLIVNWITIKVAPVIKSLFLGKLQKKSWKALLLIILVFTLTIPMLGHMQDKFDRYVEHSSGFYGVLKPGALVLLTLIYAKGQRANSFLMHVPLLFAAFFIGSERIVIFNYFIFLNYALRFRNGLNAGVVLTSIYFTWKSYEYLVNLLIHGNGFFNG